MGRAPTGCAYHSSLFPVCPHSVSVCTCVYLCSHTCVCAPVCVHWCGCTLADVVQGGLPGVCPSGTSFPQRQKLPVSPLPPWHYLCSHIRISGVPTVWNKSHFQFFTSVIVLKGNISIHKTFYTQEMPLDMEILGLM